MDALNMQGFWHTPALGKEAQNNLRLKYCFFRAQESITTSPCPPVFDELGLPLLEPGTPTQEAPGCRT